ncbi:MAG: hypothetical protein CL908_11530 [Deltaproteobacteria bacterium]|nr:hypothetical protein [Deltaproteobacteria bacterium]
MSRMLAQSTRLEQIEEVVVIGAGPAGLGLADQLAQRGLRARVLEKGKTAADAWRRMPRDMMMNSPVGVSTIAGVRVGFLEWSSVWNREQFHRHAVDFERERRIGAEFGVSVKRIEHEPDGLFRIETSEGLVRTRTVVNATGYYSKPYVPTRPGADEASLLELTVPEYHTHQAVAERIDGPGRRILIVGSRITAGQLGLELHNAGFRVTISHREPLAFGFDPKLQRMAFRAYYPYESIRLLSPAFGRQDSGHPMPGGPVRKLIEAGAIDTRPDLKRFEGREVHFVDGTVDEFDAVLWATGYRPALDHLKELVSLDPTTGLPQLSDMEAAQVPGLFFLGLDQLTNYTSRMLRGIQYDSIRLAERLARRAADRGGT